VSSVAQKNRAVATRMALFALAMLALAIWTYWPET
jgi:hypothetical protein